MQRILGHPRLRQAISLNEPERPLEDGQRATEDMRDVLGGKAPEKEAEVPTYLSVICAGILVLLRIDPNLVFNLALRPKIKGIVEMLKEMARLKSKTTISLPMLSINPADALARAARIQLLRALMRTLGSTLKAVTHNLVKLEKETWDEFKAQYDLIRAFILANSALAAEMEETEELFYGSGKQGAQTLKERQGVLGRLEKQAEVNATARVEKAVTERASSRLRDLAAMLSREDDEPSEDDTKGSRKSPR